MQMLGKVFTFEEILDTLSPHYRDAVTWCVVTSVVSVASRLSSRSNLTFVPYAFCFRSVGEHLSRPEASESPVLARKPRVSIV
jgi:hypothetical protein